MAVRGRQTLYANIFDDEISTGTSQADNRSRRDDALTARYYYHAQLLRKTYTKCLDDLSEEFYISQNNIVNRLSSRTELLKQMVTNQVTSKELKKAYPHFDWSVMRVG